MISRFFQIFASFSESRKCIVAFHKESQSFLTKHSYFLRHTSCTYFSQENIMYLSNLIKFSSYLVDVYDGRSATCWRGSKTKSPRVAIISQRGQSGKNRNSKWLFKILIYHCEWIFTKCLLDETVVVLKMKISNKPKKITKIFKKFISIFFQALNRREGLKSLSQRLSSNRDLLNADPSTKVNTILEFHKICSNYQKNWMQQWRDVSTRATSTSVVTPKFLDTFASIPTRGGGADFAHH